MPTQVQFRRGNTAQNNAFTGASGELSVDTQLKTLRVHDGSTAGGEALVNLSGAQTLTNKTLTTPTINGGSIQADLLGNATSATKLATARSIVLNGDLSGSVAFDGTNDVTLTATIAENSVALGTDTTGNYVASITNGSYITGGNGGSEGAALTLAVDATSANTASKVVARDANGDFAGRIITATDFNATSDAKLKENVVTIENALDKVMNLRGVNFTWKDTAAPAMGVIAQEVEAVIPEVVHEAEDHKTVSYGNMVGLLIEAIKAQQAQIEDLKQTINSLTNKG